LITNSLVEPFLAASMRPHKEPKSVGLERHNDGWLAVPDERAIAWFAARVPGTITPDGLTAFGFLGALLVFVGYIFAPRIPAMLWLANAGLVLNWLGDGLDGTVARLRRIERPRYGFLLDQSVDVLEQALIGVGLGLSGYVRLDIAALGLAAYFMMSILTLLRSTVSRRFEMAYGGIGLTELRCLFAALNTVMYFIPPSAVPIPFVAMTYPNLLALLWIASTLVSFVTTLVADLRKLAREE
jgi:archaetidylinositol phosphate synthase